VATSRCVTDFSICESCCWGCMAVSVGCCTRASSVEGWWARNVQGMLTFLGVRRWDPCADRIDAEVASSVMVCVCVSACYLG
jgi:hypothetical protein